MSLPPPSDLEAEAVVLSAVLWGDRRPGQLRLRPAWLWLPENRAAWAVAQALEDMGLAGLEAWGGMGRDKARQPRYSCRALGVGLDTRLAARVLPRLTSLPAWWWRRRLQQIMGRTGDPDEAARTIRARARERALIDRMSRIEAALRGGEPPDWQLVNGAVAGLLRMRAGHRREELRRALTGMVDGAAHE